MFNARTENSGELALKRGLHGIRKFRSPVIGALLTLTILLGKVIACIHAPNRVVFFDALLMVPISLLAYHEGVATGLVAGFVASAADLIMGAKVAGLPIPLFLASSMTRTMVVTRLFSLEVLAVITAVLSHRARTEANEAERRTEEFLKRIYLLERHNEEIARDARHQRAEFEQSLHKYTSLVYLLEESAQKIYSNLELDRLYQSLFRVLQECFGSTCASVYLKDGRNGSYFLASATGTEDRAAEGMPMMLRPDEFQVQELQRTRRATTWSDPRYTSHFQNNPPGLRAVMSGTILDKGEVVGFINIHAVDRPGEPDVKLMAMVCNIASIALANARLFSEVQWLADRDPLTRLLNRRTFHKQLEAHIRSRSTDSEPFALLMFDLDHFKALNDTYGHQAGDAVLEWFAAHCEQAAGRQHLVFRYGGEEFAVLMPGADAEAGRRLAERIRSNIEKTTFRYGTDHLRVTLSCGVAGFPANGMDGDDLVRKADRALYKAKGAGRNQVALSETGPGHDSAIVPYQVQAATTSRTGADGSAAGPSVRATARRPNPVL